MIIGLTIKNWRSFRDETIFSMVASPIRTHGERVARVKKYRLGLLPCAAIYGGNASGKTNLFLALNFMKRLIVRGTEPEARIPIEPFLLDSLSVSEPVEFSIDLLVEEKIYAYSFVTTETEIIEEKLELILSTSERTLFHRKNGAPNFDGNLKDLEFLRFAFQGTRANQLFITNSVSQNVQTFKPIYDWFKESLVLIAPDHRFDMIGAAKFEQSRFSKIGALLPGLDTGIQKLELHDVPVDSLALPKGLIESLSEDLKDGEQLNLMPMAPAVVFRKNGIISAQKIKSIHHMSDGSEKLFEIKQESDGSRRMMDLLPALLELSDSKKSTVYVIDELDRSLHTKLAKTFLTMYLAKCSAEARSQLIFTTHDVNLMTQDLLRKDEFWVAERNYCGESILIPFSDYSDMRQDKDIRKSYLQGRMGGVPRILEVV